MELTLSSLTIVSNKLNLWPEANESSLCKSESDFNVKQNPNELKIKSQNPSHLAVQDYIDSKISGIRFANLNLPVISPKYSHNDGSQSVKNQTFKDTKSLTYLNKSLKKNKRSINNKYLVKNQKVSKNSKLFQKIISDSNTINLINEPQTTRNFIK